MSYENTRNASISDVRHNHNYDGGVFFDEKKKRFVNMNNMDPVSYINYASNRITVILFFIFSTDQIYMHHLLNNLTNLILS
jgi:hypothetical protein